MTTGHYNNETWKGNRKLAHELLCGLSSQYYFFYSNLKIPTGFEIIQTMPRLSEIQSKYFIE